jgi:predicted secreted hydrolase
VRAPGSGGRAGSLVAGLAVALALVAVLADPWLSRRRIAGGEDESGGPRLEMGASAGFGGFARADRVRDYTLPRDHGPHFDYQTEWWYYTGNLSAGEGRHFGFQLTFFRRGLSPGPPPDGPGLATNQVFFAHLAVTDVAAGSHRFAERWARGAGRLAGARAEPLAVWLEDWRVEATSPDGATVRVVARDGPLLLDLHLQSLKPLVRHGDRGLSPKSREPGNASHYIGYTRLQARGRLASQGREVAVSGEAWFDHEWSTSALGEGAVGWDWFSLQLDDRGELMYFQIRRDDGSIEPVSGGTVVAPAGGTRRISASDVSLGVLARWTSPETGATYPARWRLRVPSEGLDLLVEPLLTSQEMRTSFVYWEGAVRLSGTRAGRAVSGHGYVELTGYARSMQGVF